MTNSQTFELIRVLSGLPAEKVDEVADFAKFLRAKYGEGVEVDISDEWTDEDMKDAARASIEYGYAGLEDEE